MQAVVSLLLIIIAESLALEHYGMLFKLWSSISMPHHQTQQPENAEEAFLGGERSCFGFPVEFYDICTFCYSVKLFCRIGLF